MASNSALPVIMDPQVVLILKKDLATHEHCAKISGYGFYERHQDFWRARTAARANPEDPRLQAILAHYQILLSTAENQYVSMAKSADASKKQLILMGHEYLRPTATGYVGGEFNPRNYSLTTVANLYADPDTRGKIRSRCHRFLVLRAMREDFKPNLNALSVKDKLIEVRQEYYETFLKKRRELGFDEKWSLVKAIIELDVCADKCFALAQTERPEEREKQIEFVTAMAQSHLSILSNARTFVDKMETTRGWIDSDWFDEYRMWRSRDAADQVVAEVQVAAPAIQPVPPPAPLQPAPVRVRLEPPTAGGPCPSLMVRTAKLSPSDQVRCYTSEDVRAAEIRALGPPLQTRATATAAPAFNTRTAKRSKLN